MHISLICAKKEIISLNERKKSFPQLIYAQKEKRKKSFHFIN